MNREDIIRMAREAFIKRGFWPNQIMWDCWRDAWITGAAAEREAAEERVTDLFADMERPYLPDIIAAIRARRQE